MADISSYPLEVQLLDHLRARPHGVIWNPAVNEVDRIRLESGSELATPEWISLLRLLAKQGLLKKRRETAGEAYDQQSLTIYYLSNRGRSLLKELGYEAPK